MNIKIICLGKIKERYLQEGIKEYSKRISKYSNIEIIELQDESIPESPSQKEIENIKRIESEKIQKYIKKTDYTVALDQYGKQYTSEELSANIQNILLNGYNTINFIIGGTVGIDQNFIKACNEKISFSKLTFPHQLVRLFLVEQIFRCFKIANNEKYHW